MATKSKEELQSGELQLASLSYSGAVESLPGSVVDLERIITDYNSMLSIHQRLVSLRKSLLENELKKQGLAVCTHHYPAVQYPSHEHQVGIYPKEEMKLFYLLGQEGPLSQHVLDLVCPDHVTSFKLFSDGAIAGGGVSVLKKNGELITETGLNVTARSIRKIARAEVFTYFGLPDNIPNYRQDPFFGTFRSLVRQLNKALELDQKVPTNQDLAQMMLG